MKPTARLRSLLTRPGGVVTPGAYDALSAVAAQTAGFEAIFLTGFGAAASLLGRPDVGLTTLPEIAGVARNMVRAVEIPVIADADTGYGNPLNVMRTVEELEQAGVAGLMLEDQVWPKRCGHMQGKQVIGAEEQVQKIRAAVAARRDPDLVIIARTDARGPLGLPEAIARGRLYAEAGADVIFIEAPESEAELRQIAAAFPDKPLMANMVEQGRTPFLTVAELQAIGFRLIAFPVTGLFAAAHALLHSLRHLRATGTSRGLEERMMTFTAFTDLVGLPRYREWEQEFVNRPGSAPTGRWPGIGSSGPCPGAT